MPFSRRSAHPGTEPPSLKSPSLADEVFTTSATWEAICTKKAGLDEAQAGISNARREINNLRHADDTTLMAENEEELKNLLMKVKEESEKAGLKLNIQKAKIMASCPITSWQIEGEKLEAVTDFIFLGSKIIVDGDCSHEIKMPAPWKESYDKPRQHIKKQRNYFTNKSLSGQSYSFSSNHVWMLGHKVG